MPEWPCPNDNGDEGTDDEEAEEIRIMIITQGKVKSERDKVIEEKIPRKRRRKKNQKLFHLPRAHCIENPISVSLLVCLCWPWHGKWCECVRQHSNSVEEVGQQRSTTTATVTSLDILRTTEKFIL